MGQALLSFSPRQAVFERGEVRILGDDTDTIGREKRSFLGRQGTLFKHTHGPDCTVDVNTNVDELSVQPHVHQDRTVKLHHHSVSLVAEHVSENQEVEVFALFLSGDLKPVW